MKKYRILIVGCGDVGCALGERLATDHLVYGLRRSIQYIPDAITALEADFCDTRTLSDLPNIDILVYCAAPNRSRNDSYEATYIDGLRNIVNCLPNKPEHIFFTSSTSVYGQDQQQWVNEQAVTVPLSDNGKIMLEAEQQVQALSCNSTIVRFSGIYGPKRLSLFNQVISGTTYSSLPLQYSNRIHLLDCAAVLCHLINKLARAEDIAALYLASDMCPTPISEVMHWIASSVNLKTTTVPVTRRSGSKRCDNQLLMSSGYTFIHPDYKSGYWPVISRFLASGQV